MTLVLVQDFNDLILRRPCTWVDAVAEWLQDQLEKGQGGR